MRASVLIASVLSACAGDRPRDAQRLPASLPPALSAPAQKPVGSALSENQAGTRVVAREGAQTVTSNAGTYQVVFETAPAPIPRGETFAIDAWVCPANAPDRPLTDVRLTADAAMPEHGHGMNRQPRVEAFPDGRFHIEGMLFHMSGRWQLYLDVTRGALTERAQIDVDLD